MLHQTALDFYGLAGQYSLHEIQPDTFDVQVQHLLEKMRTGRLQGLNVTIPYKEKIYSYLDRLTTVGRVIGAVNTIYCQQEILLGHNTDAPGLEADLDQKGLLNPAGAALILGSGGAARAATYTLLKRGWQVTIAARRLKPAQQVQQDLAPVFAGQSVEVEFLSANELHPKSSHFRLVINATPVGMAPHVEATPWPPGLRFPPQAALYDMIYNPATTRLMEIASASGCQEVYNGLGMLVQQAALAFECWTGRVAPREAMLKHLTAYLDSEES